VVAVASLGVLISAAPVPGEAPRKDPARRVLARGHRIPAGFRSLSRDRAVVMVNGRQRRSVRIRGVFESDGDTISVETLRGPRIRRGEQGAPGQKHELDVCFKDTTGRPFLVQIGGHSALDPTCEYPDEPAEHDADPAEHVDHFLTARAAISALRTVKFKRRYRQEYRAIRAQVQAIDHVPDFPDDDCPPEIACIGE
jgi:hypothetical protein